MNDNVEFRRIESAERTVDPSDVPDSLQALIPFAERLGRYGHMNVESVLDRVPQHERKALENTLKQHQSELGRWLDESLRSGPPYPACHAVFSGLRMYADISY
ncbi:MAG: hypothetical protein H8E37_12315 [Planctomycetes bacterium]|nr:hypothetical protein [Planctomycetota bacterium]